MCRNSPVLKSQIKFNLFGFSLTSIRWAFSFPLPFLSYLWPNTQTWWLYPKIFWKKKREMFIAVFHESRFVYLKLLRKIGKRRWTHETLHPAWDFTNAASSDFKLKLWLACYDFTKKRVVTWAAETIHAVGLICIRRKKDLILSECHATQIILISGFLFFQSRFHGFPYCESYAYGAIPRNMYNNQSSFKVLM